MPTVCFHPNALRPAMLPVQVERVRPESQFCRFRAVGSEAACMQISGSSVNMSATTFITNTVTGQGAAVNVAASTVSLTNNTVFQANNAK